MSVKKKAGGGQASFAGFVRDQLAGVGNLEIKRMFGGFGLYLGDVFFGILDDGKLYFKTSDKTEGFYKSAGMQPFSYEKKDTSGKRKRVYLKRYYEVPADVLENQSELKQRAADAASLGAF